MIVSKKDFLKVVEELDDSTKFSIGQSGINEAKNNLINVNVYDLEDFYCNYIYGKINVE